MNDASPDEPQDDGRGLEPEGQAGADETGRLRQRLEDEAEVRRRVESALKESERDLRETQQIARFGTWKWDVGSDAVTWSAEMFRILGYETATEVPSRAAFLDRVHPEDRPSLEKAIGALVTEREPFSIDHRIVLPDGSLRHLNSQARAESDAEGRPVRLFGIAQDISEQKESEAELRLKDLAIESSLSGIGICDLEGRLVYVNDALVRMWGFESRDEILGRPLPEFWEGDGILRTVQALRTHGRHSGEDVGRRKDGSRFPVEFSAAMLSDEQGNPRYMYGSFVDVSEKRRATAELLDLGGRLIGAQEEERQRLARELHDDVSQRLALLEVELELLGQASVTGVELTEKVARLSGRVKELSSDIHRLSYRLHPRRLERLGLARALDSLCRELGEQHQIRLEFEQEDVPESVGEDVALCLYRVAQESLQNVVRHSGARSATLLLRGESEGLRLEVTDSGVGFEPGDVRQRRGLGIVSMRERLRAVGGVLWIRSTPGKGTVVDALVPLPKTPGKESP
jgi:PAS domain S-box-containing protein